MHRTRPTLGGERQRLADGLPNVGRGDGPRGLGDRPEQRLQVEHLMGVSGQQSLVGLGADHQQRRAVQKGVRETGAGVGCARPEGGQAHPRPAAQAPHRIGHEHRRILVADQHETDTGTLQGVQHLDVLAAGKAEHDLDPRLLQRPG